MDMIWCDSIPDTDSSHVPTFYSPPMKKESRLLPHILGIVFLIINWIHQGWFFQVSYPRAGWEVHLWEISIAAISIMPSIYFFGLYLYKFTESTFRSIAGPIGWTFFVLYFLVRIACLILPLFALRSLPASSLMDVNWASFIPHI